MEWGYDKHGNIIYELINGNGKVKEYWDNDELKFEGEYLNGEINGKGKEYFEYGNLKYEGEYLNGKRNEKKEEVFCVNEEILNPYNFPPKSSLKYDKYDDEYNDEFDDKYNDEHDDEYNNEYDDEFNDEYNDDYDNEE